MWIEPAEEPLPVLFLNIGYHIGNVQPPDIPGLLIDEIRSQYFHFHCIQIESIYTIVHIHDALHHRIHIGQQQLLRNHCGIPDFHLAEAGPVHREEHPGRNRIVHAVPVIVQDFLPACEHRTVNRHSHAQ